MTRLNKTLALRLGLSRRQADDLIAKGSVAVNDQIARLGQQVSPSDNITVNQQAIAKEKAFSYIALNKPVGYVCSRRKQDDAETIYALLPDNLHHLKPVGRLDKNSSGLLLLTNDGDFAHRMTHPSFEKRKIYHIEIDKPLSEADFKMITETGVDIDGQRPSKLELRVMSQESRAGKKNSSGTLDSKLKTHDSAYEVRIYEGRNRQIHRTFGALGYNVTNLHRTTFGGYSLQDLELANGTWHDVKMFG